MPEEEDVISMDDFLPGQSSYQAHAVSKDVQAKVQFHRTSERDRPGAYTIYATYDKLAESGRIGRHQERRAQELRARLLSRVKNELLGKGWCLIETTPSGREYYEHKGLLTDDLRVQLEKTAQRIWRGSYDRAEREKVAPVEQPEWLHQVPSSYWIELEESPLEISLNPYTKMLHVRRKSLGPAQPEETHQEARERMVSVIGNKDAKARNDQGPAYERKLVTRPITFKCSWCKRQVTQQRFPGREPEYCSEACREEGKREKTRARVQEHRRKKKP